MTLTATRSILDAARAAGRGVGAFNVIHLETEKPVRAIIRSRPGAEGAERISQ